MNLQEVEPFKISGLHTSQQKKLLSSGTFKVTPSIGDPDVKSFSSFCSWKKARMAGKGAKEKLLEAMTINS